MQHLCYLKDPPFYSSIHKYNFQHSHFLLIYLTFDATAIAIATGVFGGGGGGDGDDTNDEVVGCADAGDEDMGRLVKTRMNITK